MSEPTNRPTARQDESYTHILFGEALISLESTQPLSSWHEDRVLALVNELCNHVPGGLTMQVEIPPPGSQEGD